MKKSEKNYLVFKGDLIALLHDQGQYSFLQEAHVALLDKGDSYQIARVSNIQYDVFEIQETTALDSREIELVSLKQACHLLDQEFFPVLSKAAQIILWNKQHQFCGYCGGNTIHKQNTWEKQCTVCKSIFYPRIAPSIIVLIKKDDKILMARSPHFPEGVYGLIAGFVEPGENLEEAVHREVYEEVGIKIKNLHYYDSQSWPFPNTLMLAFTAEHDSGEIKIDNVEIEAAGWYSKDNLPGRPSSLFSIASKMIEDFLQS